MWQLNLLMAFGQFYQTVFPISGVVITLQAGRRDVVLALMVGNILSTPMRAIRHQLPAYAGFYRPALALRLILANQGLRAASMAVVTLLYWWVAF